MEFDTTHIVIFLSHRLFSRSIRTLIQLKWSGDSILVGGKRFLRKSMIQKKVKGHLQGIAQSAKSNGSCPLVRRRNNGNPSSSTSQ